MNATTVSHETRTYRYTVLELSSVLHPGCSRGHWGAVPATKHCYYKCHAKKKEKKKTMHKGGR